MSPLRLLYLDVPFENEPGGDKNRSRFLWQAVRTHCAADLVLIEAQRPATRPSWTRFQPLACLTPEPPPFPRSASTPAFGPRSRDQFARLLREGNHEVVLARFATGWDLCRQAGRPAPPVPVVMDVDMLSSRLVALSWAAHRSWRRRWFLFETWRLRHFERRLFREPWRFLFTNPVELAGVRDRVAPHRAPGEFGLLPNPMPATTAPLEVQGQPVILYFGSLDSAANIDGFAYLMEDLLPLLRDDLKREGLRIHIVGKNPPAHFEAGVARAGAGLVKVVGRVDSIERAIAESRFVLLPLRVASGTRTRILEAAAQRRAVVTTPIGAEGLDLGDAVLIGETAGDLVVHIRRLAAHPDEAVQLGARLHERAASLYAPEKVAADLARSLEAFVTRRKAGAR